MIRRTAGLLLSALALPTLAADSVSLWAAGDIAVCGVDGARQTGDFLLSRQGLVLAVGDIAYPKGSQEDFARCFTPTWGALKNRLLPVPGNHEYGTPQATGYFDYFGKAAGKPGEGWHSRALNGWRIIGLNSNLEGAAAQAQLQWLEEELTAHAKECVLAYFHHPRFSSGKHGDQLHVDGLWKTLSRHKATVVLAGHDHHYERFAPLDGGGQPSAGGLRSFIVGTGGAPLYPLRAPRPGSEFRDNLHWGVLQLDLQPGRYRWAFHPVDGQARTDHGESSCLR